MVYYLYGTRNKAAPLLLLNLLRPPYTSTNVAPNYTGQALGLSTLPLVSLFISWHYKTKKNSSCSIIYEILNDFRVSDTIGMI